MARSASDMFRSGGSSNPFDKLSTKSESDRASQSRLGTGSAQAAEVASRFSSSSSGGPSFMRAADTMFGATRAGSKLNSHMMAGGKVRIDEARGVVTLEGRGVAQEIRLSDVSAEDIRNIKAGRIDTLRSSTPDAGRMRHVEGQGWRRAEQDVTWNDTSMTVVAAKDKTLWSSDYGAIPKRGVTASQERDALRSAVRRRNEKLADLAADREARAHAESYSDAAANGFHGEADRTAAATKGFGSEGRGVVGGGGKTKVGRLSGGRGPSRAAASAKTMAADGALGMLASSGDDEAGAVVSGAAGSVASVRRLKRAGMGKGTVALGAVAALSGNEDLQRLAQTEETAVRGFRFVKRRADAHRVAKAAKAAKARAQKTAVKRAYAQRKSRQIMQLAREGRTIVGQGIRTRVVSTVRALVRSVAGTVRGLGAALVGLASTGSLIPIALLLPLIFTLVLCSGGASSNSGAGSLTGVAAQVATALAGYGFSDEATAAVLGNMMQESGLNPGTDGGDGFANGATSLGLLQLTDHGSDHERTDFLNWCAANGKTWSDPAVQIEWSFSGEPGTSPYWERWGTGLATSYYELEDGYQARFGTDFYRSGDQMKASTDVDLATYSWMACYERPGSRKSYGDDVSRLDNRLRYANDFLAQIRSGGSGQDYQASSDQQKAIVDATTRVPSPGAGLCAMWVSQVYSAAGLGYPGGNANDMYWNYCTSSDRNQLKVGMLVAVPSWTGTSAGRIYGHVGIYIGDGKVISNKGWIETETLDSFIKTYGTTYTVKWGFAGGVQAN